MMAELIEMIYEYRLLLSKEECLQIALDDDEVARLRGLENLLLGECARKDTRRSMPRLIMKRPVQFTLPGGFGAGETANVSGSGIAITTHERPAVGSQIILRVAVLETATEYVFPCTVAWTSNEGKLNVGVTFDGVPSHTCLGRRNSYIGDRAVFARVSRTGTTLAA